MSPIAPRMALVGVRRLPSVSRTKPVARSLSSTISHRLSSPIERDNRQSGRTSVHGGINPIPVSYYSSSSVLAAPANNKKKKEFAKLPRLEDANPERIYGIEVNPDSLGHGVLPGNLIYKTYKWSGNTRKVPLELAHGYFWMVSDLKKTNQKPTLSNETLIPEEKAQIFPILEGLTTLDDLNTAVALPLVFLERALGLEQGKNKQKASGGGKITLVGITFRDNGFKMMPTWSEPFEEAFAGSKDYSDRVQTFSVSITERWALYPIRNTVKRVMKNNTPPEKHSSTLAYFGKQEVMDFRDVLRMHNIMTSYVFLLDDLGRVRFAGSGEASDEEVSRLVGFAEELLRESDGGATTKRTKSSPKKRR